MQVMKVLFVAKGHVSELYSNSCLFREKAFFILLVSLIRERAQRGHQGR
jgi:hypothetical protein